MSSSAHRTTYQAFMSHAQKNAEAARELSSWLEQLLSIRIFVSSIPPGANFRYRIDDALRRCKLAILFATPDSVSRQWVNFEAGAITALKKPLFPICAGGLKKAHLPSTLGDLQGCDYENDEDMRCLLLELTGILSVDPQNVQKILDAVPQRPKLAVPHPKTTPPEPAGLFRTRSEALATVVRRILENADDKTHVCFLGIAHSDLFGTYPVLNEPLQGALQRGARIRAIFLDPDSPAASRREFYESPRLKPRQEIRDKLATAKVLADRFDGRFSMQLTPDIPCYLAFDESEMVIHPYVNTRTGHDVVTIWLSSESDLYEWGKAHFDRLWGTEKWVLLDLGNVLIDFDHRRVAQGLLRHFTKPRNKRELEKRIHAFFFNFRAAGVRNDVMDRGIRDLDSLRREFCEHFSVAITEKDFQAIWFSIFADTLNQLPVRCATRLRENGLRVAICSNTNQAHWDRLVDKHPTLGTMCDEYFLSYRMGSTKTDEGFFHSVAERRNVPCEHFLLVDDRADNCRAAEAAGMYSLQYSSNDHAGSIRHIESFLDAHLWWKVPV